jgi:ribosome maturation factor RimP
MVKTDVEKEKVALLITQPLLDEGYEIAQLSLARYKTSATLRLFLYGKDGLSLDECARLSRMIGDLIEGTDLLANGYTLEVSSPGLDRPLTELIDFRYRIGETVRVEFVEPKRKRLSGMLTGVEGENVLLEVDEETISLPVAEIKSAKIQF